MNKQGPKTTKELAEMKGISQSGVSKLTKRLLEKKYIIQSGTVMIAVLITLYLPVKEKNFLAVLKIWEMKL